MDVNLNSYKICLHLILTKLINNCSKRIYTCVFEKKYDRDGMLIGYEKICK